MARPFLMFLNPASRSPHLARAVPSMIVAGIDQNFEPCSFEISMSFRASLSASRFDLENAKRIAAHMWANAFELKWDDSLASERH